MIINIKTDDLYEIGQILRNIIDEYMNKLKIFMKTNNLNEYNNIENILREKFIILLPNTKTSEDLFKKSGGRKTKKSTKKPTKKSAKKVQRKRRTVKRNKVPKSPSNKSKKIVIMDANQSFIR